MYSGLLVLHFSYERLRQIHTHTHTHTHMYTCRQVAATHPRRAKSWYKTHCNTLQHTATHCNTLQHTATHCNTLQHTATHCNTYVESTTSVIQDMLMNSWREKEMPRDWKSSNGILKRCVYLLSNAGKVFLSVCTYLYMSLGRCKEGLPCEWNGFCQRPKRCVYLCAYIYVDSERGKEESASWLEELISNAEEVCLFLIQCRNGVFIYVHMHMYIWSEKEEAVSRLEEQFPNAE